MLVDSLAGGLAFLKVSYFLVILALIFRKKKFCLNLYLSIVNTWSSQSSMNVVVVTYVATWHDLLQFLHSREIMRKVESIRISI